eukprot:3979062-Amphidinium_carterae.1
MHGQVLPRAVASLRHALDAYLHRHGMRRQLYDEERRRLVVEAVPGFAPSATAPPAVPRATTHAPPRSTMALTQPLLKQSPPKARPPAQGAQNLRNWPTCLFDGHFYISCNMCGKSLDQCKVHTGYFVTPVGMISWVLLLLVDRTKGYREYPCCYLSTSSDMYNVALFSINAK